MKRSRTGLISMLTAEGIASVGGKMSFLAVPWLVLVTTGSPTKMGLLGLVQTLPYVLSGIFATPLVDRIGMRKICILNDAISACLVAGIALYGYRNFGLLMLLGGLIGTVQGVGDRARRVMLPPVVEQAGTPMPRVSAIMASLNRLSTVVGVSIGGVVIAWIGPIGAIWINSGSLAICALIVLVLVRLPKSNEPPPPREPYFTALRGGYSFLRDERVLRGMVSMMFMTNMFNQAAGIVLIPLWVMATFDSPIALGWVAGATALGGILGNLVLIGLITKMPRYLSFVLGYLIGGSPRFLVLALSDELWVVLSVTFVSGIASSFINPTYGSLLYERVPRPLQARVFGLASAVTFGGIPLGGLVGAWLVAGFDINGALLAAGALYFMATLSPIIGYRVWKRMDETDTGIRPLPGWMGSLGFHGLRVLPLAVTGAIQKPVSVTLTYEEREWTVHAGTEVRQLTPVEALHALKVLDVPEVYDAAEQVTTAGAIASRQRVRELESDLARLDLVLGDPPPLAIKESSLGARGD